MLGSIALSVLGLIPHAPTALALQEPAQKPASIYDEAADGAQQIAAALERARRDEKRVLVQWGANWCGWCHKLHALFEQDAAVRKSLSYEYEVVLIDVGRFDKHVELVTKYGADLKGNGVPFLTVLDAQGAVLVNQETSSLELDGAHDPAKVLAFLDKYKAAPREAAPLLEAALAQAKAEQKLVFLTFGAPWCGWCHRLEDWMWSPSVAPVLAKDFVPLKLDVDRTLGGKALLTKFRGGDDGGIPWFVLLDADGKALVDSDDAGQNLGCPWTEEEIAVFGKLMQARKRRITDEELVALLKTMGPPKAAKAGSGG